MDLKTSKISRKHPSNMKEKKIKSFLSCLELSDNQDKDKQKKKNRLNPEYNKKSKDKLSLRKVEITELNHKEKLFNQIIQCKLISSKNKNKKNNKYKKISSIDIINSQNNKRASYHKKINHSQTKEEFTVVKKIKNIQRPIGRSTVSEVFKIKNPKKSFNLTNLNINYQINNIKTIDTEKAHKSDANYEYKEMTKEKEEKNKPKLKNVKYIHDDIEINTTNQETNNKSDKYLSVVLFNIKKYKKLYQNYKKENDSLKNENVELKNKMQDMKDELDIMKEEIELNKNNDKENENKFKELTEYIKQNEIKYEQKIINLKELLFSKDQEINKLNKIIDNESINKNKIIEELKRKIIEQDKIINEQKLLINQKNSVEKL